MPVTVNFVERTENKEKISRDLEIETWNTAMAAVNELVSRCNAANGTSVPTITLVTQETKGGLLSAEDYDANMTKIQNALNAIIQASGAQGLNPANTMSLFKSPVSFSRS
jgi:pterin-4a-carbinolamine dehydratase